MFGMLDYRAHRLYWLLTFPVGLLGVLAVYGCIVVLVLLSMERVELPVLQLGAAILGMEAAAIIVQIILAFVVSIIRRIFFFFVDVVPAEGRSLEEALEVVVQGDVVRFTGNLIRDPQNFTEPDEQRLRGVANRSQGWPARILRVFLGAGPGSFFTSTPDERVDAMLEIAHETTAPPDSFNLEASVTRAFKERGIYPGFLGACRCLLPAHPLQVCLSYRSIRLPSPLTI